LYSGERINTLTASPNTIIRLSAPSLWGGAVCPSAACLSRETNMNDLYRKEIEYP
jgi:hypothetical protein